MEDSPTEPSTGPPQEKASQPETEVMSEKKLNETEARPSNGSEGGETSNDEKKYDTDAVNLLGLPVEQETEKGTKVQESNLLDFSHSTKEPQNHGVNLLDLPVVQDSAVIAATPETDIFNQTEEMSAKGVTTDEKKPEDSILDLSAPIAPPVTEGGISGPPKDQTNLLDLPASSSESSGAPQASDAVDLSEGTVSKEDNQDPNGLEGGMMNLGFQEMGTGSKEELSGQQEETPSQLDFREPTETEVSPETPSNETEGPKMNETQVSEQAVESAVDGAALEPPTELKEWVSDQPEDKDIVDLPKASSNRENIPVHDTNVTVADETDIPDDPKENEEGVVNHADLIPEGEPVLLAEDATEKNEPKQNEETTANCADMVEPAAAQKVVPDAQKEEPNLVDLPGEPEQEAPGSGENEHATLPVKMSVKTDENAVPPGELALVPMESEKIRSKVQDDTTANFEKEVLIVELQSSLQEHMQEREEAEERARKAEERVRQCEEQLIRMSDLEEEIESLNNNIVDIVSQKSSLEVEMTALEQSRDEHERKAIVLSNRLNAAKKKEGIKANLVEQLEDENKELQEQFTTAQKELIMVSAEKESLEIEMEALKKKCIDRVKSAEGSLEEEVRLNEERKKKMKLYIETKSEELRVAKAHNDELQVEVEQTQISLRETNDRWKQLHAQWVQSQTRNRELQRDLNRIKKDSDHLHKIGDNLEMKLSRSAQETEEHKNKRLTAKHELMTILRTLEAERAVSGKLRDSIKFTFTPKALSQQQLLKESLEDFEAELMKLSRRLGKPLPPSSTDSSHFQDDGSSILGSNEASGESDPGGDGNGVDNEASLGNGGNKRNKSEIDSTHLLSHLESETQRVSQCIMALISNVERMHVMLDEGDRTCVTALTDLLSGVHTNSSATQDETTPSAGGARARSRLGISPYDAVPSR